MKTSSLIKRLNKKNFIKLIAYFTLFLASFVHPDPGRPDLKKKFYRYLVTFLKEDRPTRLK